MRIIVDILWIYQFLFRMTGAAADLVQRFHTVLVHPCCHLVRNGLHRAGVQKEDVDTDGMNYLAGQTVDFVNKSAMNGT